MPFYLHNWYTSPRELIRKETLVSQQNLCSTIVKATCCSHRYFVHLFDPTRDLTRRSRCARDARDPEAFEVAENFSGLSEASPGASKASRSRPDYSGSRSDYSGSRTPLFTFRATYFWRDDPARAFTFCGFGTRGIIEPWLRAFIHPLTVGYRSRCWLCTGSFSSFFPSWFAVWLLQERIEVGLENAIRWCQECSIDRLRCGRALWWRIEMFHVCFLSFCFLRILLVKELLASLCFIAEVFSGVVADLNWISERGWMDIRVPSSFGGFSWLNNR